MAITVTPAALPDDFAGTMKGLDSPSELGKDVTPSDSAQSLTFLPRAITCQVGGTIAVMWKDGSTSTHSIAEGAPLPIRPVAVLATGTTATGIAALK